MRLTCLQQNTRASCAAGRRHGLLLLGAALCLLGAAAVPTAAQQGACFVWDNNGRCTTVTGVTEAECNALTGWDNHYFIEGGTTNANGLPVKNEGNGYWRYVVCVYDCRCNGNLCEEEHMFARCWWDDTSQ